MVQAVYGGCACFLHSDSSSIFVHFHECQGISEINCEQHHSKRHLSNATFTVAKIRRSARLQEVCYRWCVINCVDDDTFYIVEESIEFP